MHLVLMPYAKLHGDLTPGPSACLRCPGRYCTWLVSSVQASDYINTPGVYNGTICSVVSLLVWSRTIAHHAHCCCSAGCVSVQLLHCLGNLPHSFGDKVEQKIYAGRQHGQA